ncbi:M23 family metallopeptidase [Candidatus Bipolaricaulota bacterium]|nr:M23 family metallopeptidase [Candidatus Bipolaricaulota bacterium]
MSDNPILAVAIALLFLPLLLVPFLPSPQAGGPVASPPATTSASPTYVVRPGDTLSGIADRYGVPLAYLVASNGITDPSLVRPGQLLYIPQGGVLHTVKPGQTVADIAKTYDVAEDAIRSANNLVGEPSPGARLLVPAPGTVPQATAVELGQGRSSLFVWPARGPISSPFGPRVHPIYRVPSFHSGVDIALPEGTTVYAAAPGRVVEADWHGGYGLLVVIDHGNGYTTYYGHLSRLLVFPGQFVEAGQPIARSGNTGLSTGPHLHFEVRQGDNPVDPLPLLP